ncbi:membrane protein FxsA [Desulfuribacillus stibiiarsenatis]|uniref:Membrane protein FxsA n=1 Tax=Desulfuribacillus stibiiarsenatis TaxID=1390249 RepID=A0A1E5L2Z1_9FIRM|nr:FxsA family protein [Desulfuribacillus stibiiarsenatis]OEH84467.1 membrane protein FxsA [Desulfuribacillus stibiiarsenatis]
MLRLLTLLFILVPALEIYVIIKVGQIFGAWTTLGFIIFTGFLGAYLAKSQGRQTLLLAQLDLQQGRIPGEAILDGLAILVGGLLLLTPGFVTDVVGFLLLIPTSRGILKLWMRTWFSNILRSGNILIYKKW